MYEIITMYNKIVYANKIFCIKNDSVPVNMSLARQLCLWRSSDLLASLLLAACQLCGSSGNKAIS
jgi:hypothetical protein